MEKSKFEAQRERLEGICDENQLVYRFRGDQYPITLTIRPNNGVGVQLSMLAADEMGHISPNAYIRFSYEDGSLAYDIFGKFPIGDALFTKLRIVFVRMHMYYQQYFFRDIISRGLLAHNVMPYVKDGGEYKGKPLDGEESENPDDSDDSDNFDDSDDSNNSEDSEDSEDFEAADNALAEATGGAYDYEPVRQEAV